MADPLRSARRGPLSENWGHSGRRSDGVTAACASGASRGPRIAQRSARSWKTENLKFWEPERVAEGVAKCVAEGVAAWTQAGSFSGFQISRIPVALGPLHDDCWAPFIAPGMAADRVGPFRVRCRGQIAGDTNRAAFVDRSRRSAFHRLRLSARNCYADRAEGNDGDPVSRHGYRIASGVGNIYIAARTPAWIMNAPT
jgi:hypothetical protein